ncbi:MAG: hypothetical protein ACSHWS_17485 [Sulfitobacter sp.]
MKKAIALLIAFTVFALQASAEEFTTAENKALRDRVASVERAMIAGDYQIVTEIAAPKMLKMLAERIGLDKEAMAREMSEKVEEQMSDVTIEAYILNLDGAKTDETSTGRTYILIPTQVIMTLENGIRFESNYNTLAFTEAGIWYLMRMDDLKQNFFLTEAYPEFKGIDFPAGTTKILED